MRPWRAGSIAARGRMLPGGSLPPAFAAMMISGPSLLNSFPRCWSVLPFLILMLCHLECPDTAGSPPLRPDTRAPGAASRLYYNPAIPGAQATKPPQQSGDCASSLNAYGDRRGRGYGCCTVRVVVLLSWPAWAFTVIVNVAPAGLIAGSTRYRKPPAP